MKKLVKRPYNKWSEEAIDVICSFITKEEDENLPKLRFILRIVEGFERKPSSIYWQVAKQRKRYGLNPKYAGYSVV